MAKPLGAVNHGDKPTAHPDRTDPEHAAFDGVAPDAKAIQSDLLAWYDKEQRALPWRASPGKMPNPYHVWLSEIMLQQTVVKTVIPYFHAFIEKWPTIHDLATASLEEVRSLWAGLGYYSRAANLHKCARLIVEDYDGNFPIFAEELETLPGIGPTLAGAIVEHREREGAFAAVDDLLEVDGIGPGRLERLASLVTV